MDTELGSKRREYNQMPLCVQRLKEEKRLRIHSATKPTRKRASLMLKGSR